MFKNIDKVKKNIGETVFNHINSLSKTELEKQLSELKEELKSANKDGGQRYLKLKDEEFLLLYRLERANEFKYKDGGGVEERYVLYGQNGMWYLKDAKEGRTISSSQLGFLNEFNSKHKAQMVLDAFKEKQYAKGSTVKGGGVEKITQAELLNENFKEAKENIIEIHKRVKLKSGNELLLLKKESGWGISKYNPKTKKELQWNELSDKETANYWIDKVDVEKYAKGSTVKGGITIHELENRLSEHTQVIDDRTLDSEEIHNWGADNVTEYKKAQNEIDKIKYKGKGWEIYGWYDVSSFDYWMIKQEEQNYIQITIKFKNETVKEEEVDEIADALDSALADADRITNKYNYNPSKFAKGSTVKGGFSKGEMVFIPLTNQKGEVVNFGSNWATILLAHSKERKVFGFDEIEKLKNGGGIDINDLNMPVIRTQFEDEEYEFKDGGNVKVGDKVMLPEIKMRDGKIQFEKVENGEVLYIENGIYGVLNPKTKRIHQVSLNQIKYKDGGKIYSSDDRWVVTFQNQDNSEFEKVTVRANNKKSAIASAEDESGLGSDWEYYSAEKQMANGGATKGFCYTIGGL